MDHLADHSLNNLICQIGIEVYDMETSLLLHIYPALEQVERFVIAVGIGNAIHDSIHINGLLVFQKFY